MPVSAPKVRSGLVRAPKICWSLVATVVIGWVGLPMSLLGQRAPDFGYAVVREVMVPMRDGVRLATDVYHPTLEGERAPGPFPTLLTRTAYGRESGGEAPELARRGYVVLVQDVRGRFDSEGTFYPYINDAADGNDTAAWILDQSWSDGRIGAFGSSYTANSANAMASTSPDGLAAVFVTVGGSNYWEDAAGYGGAWQPLHNLGWALGHASDEFERISAPPPEFMILSDAYDNLWNWLLKPVESHQIPLSAMPEWAGFYQDWAKETSFGPYWQQSGFFLENAYDAIARVPIFQLGGWYDLFLKGTLRNFRGVHEAGGRAHLVVGPWSHSRGRSPEPFGFHVDFGPEAASPPLLDYQLRWFDRWLGDGPEAFPGEAPVRFFVMGGGDGHRTSTGALFHGGHWRTESNWPPPDVELTPYYLHADGTLSAQEPGEGPPSEYSFDPSDPVPTLGGNMTHTNFMTPVGPTDQRCRAEYLACRGDELPLAARSDVLVFESEPLEQDVEVTGPLRARLWIASSAPDTDFTAKLVDVYPPSEDFPHGFAMNVADGIIRARYRNSLEHAEALEAGRVYEVEIDLAATSNLFQAGHRIRIDISSSNFPRFDVNPNTGQPTNSHTYQQTSRNRIYHDPEHPSHIMLPIIPGRK